MLSPNWLVFALFHISARYSGFTFDIQLFGTGEGVMCFFILPVLLWSGLQCLFAAFFLII